MGPAHSPPLPHPPASLPLRREKSSVTGPGRPAPWAAEQRTRFLSPTYGCCRPQALLNQCQAWKPGGGSGSLSPLSHPPGWLLLLN
jgi:hypothetical protein